jgi:hypothetical protein
MAANGHHQVALAATAMVTPANAANMVTFPARAHDRWAISCWRSSGREPASASSSLSRPPRRYAAIVKAITPISAVIAHCYPLPARTSHAAAYTVPDRAMPTGLRSRGRMNLIMCQPPRRLGRTSCRRSCRRTARSRTPAVAMAGNGRPRVAVTVAISGSRSDRRKRSGDGPRPVRAGRRLGRTNSFAPPSRLADDRHR